MVECRSLVVFLGESQVYILLRASHTRTFMIICSHIKWLFSTLFVHVTRSSYEAHGRCEERRCFGGAQGFWNGNTWCGRYSSNGSDWRTFVYCRVRHDILEIIYLLTHGSCLTINSALGSELSQKTGPHHLRPIRYMSSTPYDKEELVLTSLDIVRTWAQDFIVQQPKVFSFLYIFILSVSLK